MPKYSHAFDFAFELVSYDEHGEDVTGAMLRQALLTRINSIPDSELTEACGLFDTYTIEQD